ncbi:glycoside hydrolase [Paenibacillus sp. N4]|uniref:sialidase family protein n=1 Tax=Paenibacillus vietnamensis TaxID=2590547 RepID=UPI001CD08431|nr:sialidase family protein [Paenibacillus vietnamensis]MCA0758620.1 glycoside hydrolase [Paenibacillus vietnamensis]
MGQTENQIRYAGGVTANLDYHHGQLRPAVGVRSRQAFRANRTHPELSDGSGWTYNHAPMLAYWKGSFYLEYLSCPVHEHVPPGQTLLTTSKDGWHWSAPVVLFPPYVLDHEHHYPDGECLPEGTYSVMHQRMGFYAASNGRLLALGFYGFCPLPSVSPNNGKGIGRVVREIGEDGSFGPVYFIRLNRHSGWNESNVKYPMYTESGDEGFREACGELLADRIATLQWWEEDRSRDGFYAVEAGTAFNSYRLPDGRIAGLWKHSVYAVTEDEGKTWSKQQRSPSLIMAGGKVWGERTSDSRYALLYNPSPIGNHRWPLAVVTGDDGFTFDDMLVVNGEVPPRRYFGFHKNYGMSYTRGIEAGDGAPPDGSMWVTYSSNKEDIWVSEIPVPVRYRVSGQVNDTFDGLRPEDRVPDWNVYSPLWASVSVSAFPSEQDRSLELRDSEPYDYAKAERVFEECAAGELRIRMLAKQADEGRLFIELCDAKSAAPIRLRFHSDGAIQVLQAGTWIELQRYEADKWYELAVRFDTERQRFEVRVNGEPAPKAYQFSMPAYTLEKLVLRTGPLRTEPHAETPLVGPDLPDADEQVKPVTYYINEVNIKPITGG